MDRRTKQRLSKIMTCTMAPSALISLVAEAALPVEAQRIFIVSLMASGDKERANAQLVEFMKTVNWNSSDDRHQVAMLFGQISSHLSSAPSELLSELLTILDRCDEACSNEGNDALSQELILALPRVLSAWHYKSQAISLEHSSEILRLKRSLERISTLVDKYESIENRSVERLLSWTAVKLLAKVQTADDAARVQPLLEVFYNRPELIDRHGESFDGSDRASVLSGSDDRRNLSASLWRALSKMITVTSSEAEISRIAAIISRVEQPSCDALLSGSGSGKSTQSSTGKGYAGGSGSGSGSGRRGKF